MHMSMSPSGKYVPNGTEPNEETTIGGFTFIFEDEVEDVVVVSKHSRTSDSIFLNTIRLLFSDCFEGRSDAINSSVSDSSILFDGFFSSAGFFSLLPSLFFSTRNEASSLPPVFFFSSRASSSSDRRRISIEEVHDHDDVVSPLSSSSFGDQLLPALSTKDGSLLPIIVVIRVVVGEFIYDAARW